MTKEEMVSLGIPAENLKNFQNMYFRDINRAAQRMAKKPDSATPDELMKAVVSMLPLINSVDSLKNILSNVSYHCMKEYQAPKPDRVVSLDLSQLESR